MDVDATLLERTRGPDWTMVFQPVVALWAELEMIVHDEFRADNVPASCGNWRILGRAAEALQQDLDRWLEYYNRERPYRGYRNLSQRPVETFELALHPQKEPTPQAA